MADQEYNKQYYQKNKEKIRLRNLARRAEKSQYNKEYATQNKEKIAAYRKDYNIQNKQAIKERKDKYTRSNEGRFSHAQLKAKQRNKNFSLSFEEYVIEISKPCHYCGGLLNTDKNKGIGLDRLDNSLGYDIGNVVSCCGFCNKTRGDRLSYEETKAVISLVVQLRGLVC